MLKLTPQGMVHYRNGVAVRLDREETTRVWGFHGFPEDIPSPEVVHLEVTADCNLNCPYCYVEKHKDGLPTDSWLNIIGELADLDVFQVTFGGGEPLLRDDLEQLAEHAKSRGMDVTMTTNGFTVPDRYRDLSCFDQVNVSYHGDASVVAEALDRLEKDGIRRGINMVLKREYAKDLGRLTRLARMYDAELLMLSYKTRDDTGEVIPPYEAMKTAWQASSEAKVAVDGATLSECWCNYRFATVDARGNLMPCSFIREPQGNLTENLFIELWRDRKRYRHCPHYDLDNSHCWEPEVILRTRKNA